jgi:hypothetical protein
MLALPAQAQQVVMTPEGTGFLMVPSPNVTINPVSGGGNYIVMDNQVVSGIEQMPISGPIKYGKGTPFPDFIGFTPPEVAEGPRIVPGSYRGDLSIPSTPGFQWADPGSVRVGGENAVLYRDAKLINTPEQPLRELTEEEFSRVGFTTSARVLNNQVAPVNVRAAATPLIPNPNLRMINVSENGSPLSASRIFPLPAK